MEKSLPLNDWHAKKTHRAINRFHSFSHGFALLALFYYRITSIVSISKSSIPIVPHFLIFTSELILSFMWLLCQASNWNPVARTAYPDRLPADDNLPSIDVFVCTADPTAEPSLGVMNTVISAMALDYPPHKLHLYLSDDGGSPVTLRCLKEAWRFAKLWIPFCRKYMVKNRCPGAYFFRQEIAGEGKVSNSDHFFLEKKEIEEAYEDFKTFLGKIVVEGEVRASRDHPPIIEVINDANSDMTDPTNDQETPLVVYVAREKRPSHPHNFKAGALNVLLRVGEGSPTVGGITAGAAVVQYADVLSKEGRKGGRNEMFKKVAQNVGVLHHSSPCCDSSHSRGSLPLRVSGLISNSPYILSLDCDMYCNDTTSARQAMCFHLDPKLSKNLAFVQFPQRFHNINRNDIYDGALRFIWPKWEGFNGLRGPVLSGTGFYIKREALYGTRKLQPNVDLNQLKKYYGSSDEFIKSIYRSYKPNYPSNTMLTDDETLHKELHLLASCSHDDGTQWGKEVGYRYFAVVEDYFTGFNLHCEGWISVYIDPSRPCFLGTSPISLGEFLVQNTRWFLGLSQIALSKYSPLVYGSLRMSILQSMIYAELAFYAIYFLPVYILVIVPQLCLLCGIPLYPEVSSPFFGVFVFVFFSSQLKHVQEVYETGNPIRTWSNEQRVWMIKSLTAFFFAALNSIMEKIGLIKASFVPTNKETDDEAAKLYEMGKYNFEAPPLFMVPLCTVYMLNLASFVFGLRRIFQNGKINEMVMQEFIPLFSIVLHFPLLEGLVLRKDKGRVSQSVSLISAVISSVALAYAALFHYY